MSFSAPQPPAVPSAPPPPPVLGQAPQGKKPQAKSQQTSFLGTGDVPAAANKGQKTLLGQ